MLWSVRNIFKFLLPILLLAGPTWAATITSAGTGAWSTGGTWTGGAAPGPSDTAVIATGHVVTIAAAEDITVGTNPGDETTAAVTVQGTGQLHIDGILRCQGALTYQRGSLVEVGPDAVLYLDSANASYQYQSFPASAGSGSATLSIVGTPGHRGIIDGNGGRGGKLGRVNGVQTSTNNISFSYGILRNLSQNAAAHGFSHSIGAGQSQTLSNVLFTSVYRGTVTMGAGDANLTWSGVDIRNSVTTTATNYPTIVQTADKTTGTRSITNLTMYEGTTVKLFVLSAQGFSINGMYRHNVKLSVNGTTAPNIPSALAVVGDFTTQSVAANEMMQALANGSQSFSESVYLGHGDNWHAIDETYSAGVAVGANTYSGWLFDGDSYVSGGPNDSIIVKGEATITKSLGIGLSGILCNAYAATCAVTVTRNTVVGDVSKATEDSALINVAENGHAATQLVATTSNLVSGVYAPIRQLGAFEAQSGWTLDYNGSYANGFATNLDYPVGHPYAGTNSYLGAAGIAAWWTPGQTFGTDNAMHDVVADPEFVNSSWTIRGYFGAADVEAVGREIVTINGIAYDGTTATPTTKTVTSTLTAARAAFTPQNKLLKGAGLGGVDVGAMNVKLKSRGGYLDHYQGHGPMQTPSLEY